MVRTQTHIPALLIASTALLWATACSSGGGGGRPDIDAGASTVDVTPLFGAVADGTDAVAITVTLVDEQGDLAANREVAIAVSGSANSLSQAQTTSDANGVVTATLATTIAEEKVVTVTADTGNNMVTLDSTPSIVFVWPLPQTFYVRVGGDDAAMGDSPNRAWETLAFAATQVLPGDTVYIGGGTYAESVSLTRSGAAGDEVFFVADRTGVFTGDAGEVIVDAGGADHGLEVDGATHIVLQGLTVTGAAPGGNAGGGISIRNGADAVSVLDATVYGNDRGVWVDGSSNVAIETLVASNNVGGDGDGVSIGDSASVTVRNARVYGNGRFGVHLRNAVTGFTLDLATLYQNGGDQVREDGTGSAGTIENSIVALGLADGLDLVGGTALAQNHNCFHGNSGDDYVVGGVAQPLDNGSFSADPLLTDPDGGDDLLGGAEGADDDFSVDPTSPTLDAGDVDAQELLFSFGRGALSGASTRSDGVLDGTNPDGPTVNLGWHLPAQSDPLGGIESGDGRLFYGRGDNVQVFGRAWDADNATWEPSTLTDPAVATVKWVRNEVSPINSREELLAIFSDTGTETELSVRLWNGLYWTEAGGPDPIDSQIPSANADQRGFDIAYERLSGEAMVVYSDDTNIPVYRTFAQGTWSGEAPVFTDMMAVNWTGSVLWVELASSGTSDEIGLAGLTADGNLFACEWDGSAWDQGTSQRLTSNIAVLTESQGFDVAYEQLSGDLLVGWGRSIFAEELDFAVLANGSNDFVLGIAPSIEAVPGIVRFAPEPGSDRIAIGISEGISQSPSDSSCAIWNGSGFQDILEVAVNTGAEDARDCAVSWVGTTGIAVFVWKGDDGGGALDWARFRSTGWQIRPDEPFAGIGDMEFIQATSSPGSDEMMVLLSDDTGSLWGMTYDSESWTFTNGGMPLETNLSELGQSAQPFSFAFKP